MKIFLNSKPSCKLIQVFIEFTNIYFRRTKTDNLTQAERSALRDIQERDDIIIKPADKGSAVVVMDKTTYIQEAERQH
jgi:reverse gyrase